MVRLMLIQSALFRALFRLFLLTAMVLQSQLLHAREIDQSQAVRLLWSTMIAIQVSNDSGNYSALRDWGAPSFKQSNSTRELAEIFRGLREANIDLSTTLLIEPRYTIKPQLTADGLLRMRGQFPLRPKAINFDLLFQPIMGRWQLIGVAVIAGDP